MFRTKIKKREAEIIKIINSLSECTSEQKKQKVESIQFLYAMELFDNKQYSQAMKEFLKLKTDVAVVIKLIPELNHDDKEKIKKLMEKDLASALKALVMYLKELRANIKSNTNCNVVDTCQSESTIATTAQQLELIDTTLLKCYLQANYEVVPLLKMNNYCRLEEAEKLLQYHKKYNELLILYQTKGQHMKALQLLREQATASDTSLEVYQGTINYLQQLDADHLSLIFTYSDWVLKEHPVKGLEIFTNENEKVKNWPRPKVLEFLDKERQVLVIPYLEHVIHTWNDTNSLLHDKLINMYREKITDEKINLTDAEKQQIKAKLVAFLETSEKYTPEIVLKHFPTDSLFEERAIIYGKLGRHEQALAIYVLILGDIERAIQYCKDMTAGLQPGSQDVYVILIRILVNPEKENALIDKFLADAPRHPKTSVPDLETALNILDAHANNISPYKVVSLLPDSVPLNRLKKFLESALDGQLTLKRRTQVRKGLLCAEHTQEQKLEKFFKSQSIIITDSHICPVCKKRFGNQSAFVRYPNGVTVHFSCQSKRSVSKYF